MERKNERGGKEREERQKEREIKKGRGKMEEGIKEGK